MEDMETLEKKGKIVKIIIGIISVCLVIALSFFVYKGFTYSPFKDNLQVEASSTLDLKSYLKDSSKKVELVKGLTETQLKTVGEYEFTAKVNNKEYTSKIKVVDTTKPVIEGVKDLSVNINGELDYKQGITIKDNTLENVELIVDSSKVDLTKMGEYPVIYNATDKSGNKATTSAKVIVYIDPLSQKNTNTTEKIVYLTFDDGPSATTSRILDILKEKGVHGTFFVTAQFKNYLSTMTRAHNEGNAIAIHTYSHDFSIYRSEETYFEDLEKMQSVIKKYTGTTSKIVRFPGGSSNAISKKYNQGIMTRLTRSVLAKGYQYVDWNVDSTDASGNNVPADKLVYNATTTKHNDICILMHDTDAKATTAEALPRIIDFYKENGYKFGTLTDPSYVCHHNFINN